jgi:hypothetical protein
MISLFADELTGLDVRGTGAGRSALGLSGQRRNRCTQNGKRCSE